jgi:hypothetical protein
MDLRPRKSSLLRSTAWGALAGLTLLGCGPPSTADRATPDSAQDGSADGRGGGGRGGSGGSAQGGTGGGGGAAGTSGADSGGSPGTDAGGTEAPGGAGGAAGSGGVGGTGGGAGQLGSDGSAELDVLFAPDVPVDLPPLIDATPGPPELGRGRVAHWKLDEGRGNVGSDSSGIGNHGGTVNILGPDWKPGRIGTALEFTPVRRTFMVVPSHETIGPTEAISLSVWVNAASWADAPRIVQKGEDDTQYSLRAENNKLRFVLRLAEITALEIPLPPTGQWVHLAATYDRKEMRLYQNGTLVKALAATGSIAQPFTSLYLGTRSQSAADTDFFAGLIDEVIIYERPLSPAEVKLLSEGKSP